MDRFLARVVLVSSLATLSTSQPLARQDPPPASSAAPREGDATVFVLAERNPLLATVWGSVWIRGGEAMEPEGREGLAELLCATWVDGGSVKLDGQKLAEWLEAHGASIAASASYDHLALDFTCKPEDLELLFDKLCDLMRQPALPSALIEERRASMIEDLDVDAPEPFELLERLALGLEWRAGRSATRESLEGITRAELAMFHHGLTQPSRMVIGVHGNVDPAAFEKVAREELSFWVEAPELNEAPTVEIPPAERATFYVWPRETDEVELYAIGPGPSPASADFATLRAWRPVAAASSDGDSPSPRAARGEFVATASDAGAFRAAAVAAPRSLVGAVERINALIAPKEGAADASPIAADVGKPVESGRAQLARILRESLRGSTQPPPAVALDAAGARALVAKYVTPDKLTFLAIGPRARLTASLKPLGDVFVLDASGAAPSTLDGLAKLEQLFGKLGGRERWAKLRATYTEGDAVIQSGDRIATRQWRDYVEMRWRQERESAAGVDAFVFERGESVTLRGGQALRSDAKLHARLRHHTRCQLFQLLHDLAVGDRRGVRVAKDGMLEVLDERGRLCWLEIGADGKPARMGWAPTEDFDGGLFVYGEWDEIDGYPYPKRSSQPEQKVESTTGKIVIDPPLSADLFTTRAN